MQRLPSIVSLLPFAFIPLSAVLFLSGLPLAQTAALLLLLTLLSALLGWRGRGKQQLFGLLLFALVCLAVLCGRLGPLLYYPVVMSLAAAAAFACSPFFGMPLIERLARQQEPTLPAEGVEYCRRLNVLWGLVLIANACVALVLAETAPFEDWLLYNGVLSYLLMGGVFGIELWYRKLRLRRARSSTPNTHRV